MKEYTIRRNITQTIKINAENAEEAMEIACMKQDDDSDWIPGWVDSNSYYVSDEQEIEE